MSSASSFSINGVGFEIRTIDDSYPVIVLRDIEDDPTRIIDTVYSIDKESMKPCLLNPETGNYESAVLPKLHGKITLECPSFGKSIKPLDILNGTFVSPVVNTPRMIAQQGLFMLYGLSAFWDVIAFINHMCDKNLKYGKRSLLESILHSLIWNSDDFLRKDKSGFADEASLIAFLNSVFNAWLYRIEPGEKKKEILEGLSFLGISKATMGRSEITTSYEIS